MNKARSKSSNPTAAAAIRALREEFVGNCMDQLDDGVAVGGAALGWCAALGLVIRRDRRAAWPVLIDAARKGSTDAAYLIALGHHEGWIGPPCHRTAARLYRQLAERGYAAAACQLGLMHIQGTGVRYSRAMALRWYELATRLGDCVAARNWFDLLRGGTLDEQRQARRLARRLDRDCIGFATLLGAMHERGEGGRPSRSEAIRLCQRDAAHGHEPAVQALRRLGEVELKQAGKARR